MKYRKVTAIVPLLALEQVEKALLAIGVAGMTITKVRGMGEYRNYYAQDSLTDSCRIEIFAEMSKVKEITHTIASMVGQGMSTDGIIAILPVEEFFHIKDLVEE